MLLKPLHPADGAAVGVLAAVRAWRRVNRGGYRPFLQQVTAGRPVVTRPLRRRQSRRLPRTLTEEQLLALLEACEHLRDRFRVRAARTAPRRNDPQRRVPGPQRIRRHQQ